MINIFLNDLPWCVYKNFIIRQVIIRTTFLYATLNYESTMTGAHCSTYVLIKPEHTHVEPLTVLIYSNAKLMNV